jgi:hypothetical protein
MKYNGKKKINKKERKEIETKFTADYFKMLEE